LNKVVFPEPFGPIIPVIVPFLTFKEKLETAASPTKYIDKILISKIIYYIRVIYLVFYECYLKYFLMIYKNQLWLTP
jgi:hypothetical protein